MRDHILEFIAEPVAFVLSLVLWAILGATHAGCGANLLEAQATVHTETQGLRFEFYHVRDRHCRATEPTFESWEACMLPAYDIQAAADTYRDALLAIEGGDQTQCAAHAAETFVGVLRRHHVQVPTLIAAAVHGECE